MVPVQRAPQADQEGREPPYQGGGWLGLRVLVDLWWRDRVEEGGRAEVRCEEGDAEEEEGQELGGLCVWR